MGVINLGFPVFGPRGDVETVLSCPYIERRDSIEVPSQTEVVERFAALAQELTDLFGGRGQRQEPEPTG